MRELGIPIQDRVSAHGRKTFDIPRDAIPRIKFTYDEALALLLCQAQASVYEGTSLRESSQTAFEKIHVALGPLEKKYLDRMLPRLHRSVVGGDYHSHNDVIEALTLGIEDSRATFITYHRANSTEPVTYDIHPYALAEHCGNLYVVGFSCHHDEIRTWKIDRMLDAEARGMSNRSANLPLSPTHVSAKLPLSPTHGRTYTMNRAIVRQQPPAPGVGNRVSYLRLTKPRAFTPRPHQSQLSGVCLSPQRIAAAWRASSWAPHHFPIETEPTLTSPCAAPRTCSGTSMNRALVSEWDLESLIEESRINFVRCKLSERVASTDPYTRKTSIRCRDSLQSPQTVISIESVTFFARMGYSATKACCTSTPHVNMCGFRSTRHSLIRRIRRSN